MSSWFPFSSYPTRVRFAIPDSSNRLFSRNRNSQSSFFTHSNRFLTKEAPFNQTLESGIRYFQISEQTPIESSDSFKIVIVLDESGSMASIRDDMIKAINDLITEQKQITECPCRFTLVKFNDQINRVIQNKELKDIEPLTDQDYIPSRSTALYDAIGSTVDWFRYEKNVLMVIVTDGQENASKKYSKEQINKMLDEKRKNRNWSYVYFSDDLTNSRQGDKIGLKESTYASNKVVSKSLFGDYCSKNINSAIRNFRVIGLSVQSQLD